MRVRQTALSECCRDIWMNPRRGTVAVGTALAGRPPHRSRRAELPHRAPASGGDAEAHQRIGMTDAGLGKPASYPSLPPDVPAQVHLARTSSGPVSGARFAQAGSPWPTPFPPSPPQLLAEPCSETSQVIWGCPTSHGRPSWACVLGLPHAASWTPSQKATVGSPDSRPRCFRTCTGSSTAQGPCASRAIDAHDIAFRYVHSVGTLEYHISRLNTRPARTPVNASPEPSRVPAHDSGPVWLATPSPYDSLIRDTSPVFTGALPTSP